MSEMRQKTARTAPTSTPLAAGLARARALDARLVGAPRWFKVLVLTLTIAIMAWGILANIPREYADYSGVPLLTGLAQPETYGTDTIADMYEAKAVLHDPLDMYTKTGLAQTPREGATWSKEASAPYPPAVLLAEAALYAVGDRIGIGFYGAILALAGVWFAASLVYFVKTRWYLFPLLYLNFGYWGYRFAYVQDGSYLVMLVVILGALWLARSGYTASHALMAIAIAMKLSPAYYMKNLPGMTPAMRALFVGLVVAGLVLPYFIWDNYLYIFSFGSEKGSPFGVVGATLVALPFAVLLWYVESRTDFDREERVGWDLVPVAMFLALKMNAARHLLIVLLVPDKRAARNIVAAIGVGLYTLFPNAIRLGAVGYIISGLLYLPLVACLARIGWATVRDDARHPARTARMMLARAGRGGPLPARDV